MKKYALYFLPILLLLGGCDSATPPMDQLRGAESSQSSYEIVEEVGGQVDVVAEIVNTQKEDNVEKTKKASAVAPNGTYTNVNGNEVARPYMASSIPAGASAQCRDGTYSFSQNRRGTCSGHGGVATWY